MQLYPMKLFYVRREFRKPPSLAERNYLPNDGFYSDEINDMLNEVLIHLHGNFEQYVGEECLSLPIVRSETWVSESLTRNVLWIR